MESGPKYIGTPEGILQILVIAFSCTTFALLADSGKYDTNSTFKWIFSAYIIAFSISLILFVLRVTEISSKLSCGSAGYDGVDFVWAWFCAIWCTAASVTFAVNFDTIYPNGNNYTKGYGECIASVCLGFVTSVLYGVEAFVLRGRAPLNMGYLSTMPGWVHSLLVGFGAATFGLLVDSGYNWCYPVYGSCYSAITYALAIYIISWGVTTILWLAHMATKKSMDANVMKFEVVWSAFCVVTFITGSSCFAAYMECNSFETINCQKRLTGVILGFLTAVLYAVDVVILKKHAPIINK